MKISNTNRRLSVADNSELALTTSQRIVMAHWLAGFDAHDNGLQRDAHPHYQFWASKVRKVWQNGWDASQTVDKVAASLFL